MPIRPENRERYPKDWKLRSRFVRFVRARGRCEWCGVRHGDEGYWHEGAWTSMPHSLRDAGYRVGDLVACSEGYTIKLVRVVLTTAHVFDDRPEASSLLNLAALCQLCHNRHDNAARRAGTRERARRHTGDLFA